MAVIQLLFILLKMENSSHFKKKDLFIDLIKPNPPPFFLPFPPHNLMLIASYVSSVFLLSLYMALVVLKLLIVG